MSQNILTPHFYQLLFHYLTNSVYKKNNPNQNILTLNHDE